MKESSTFVEKRRFTRIPFEAAVHLTNPQGDWYGKLLDISLKGVLITRPPYWRHQPGDRFLLEVHAPGGAFEIRMDAKVAHVSEHEVGFRCMYIDVDSMAHLRRLVELNVGNEQLLNRELSLLGED